MKTFQLPCLLLPIFSYKSLRTAEVFGAMSLSGCKTGLLAEHTFGVESDHFQALEVPRYHG